MKQSGSESEEGTVCVLLGRATVYRIDKILQNDWFQEYLGKNMAAEAERCFCRHDMVHFLDVARIGMILNLKEGQGIDEEVIYAAGLLHDIDSDGGAGD